jgi:single-strand DNA-binding protein
MLNKAIIGGRLTRSPEETVSTTGTVISKFTVAINRRYNRDETDFLNVVAFGKTAEFVNKYFQKGSAIIVVGSIQSRTYEKDGQKRYITEIVADEVNFGGSKKESGDSGSAEASSDPLEGLITAAANEGFNPLDNDDDLPF